MALPTSADALEARSAKTAQLQLTFQHLAESANTLNKESDKFSGIISAIDEALNRLSPGVSAWVIVTRIGDEDEPWMSHEERLGFAKTNNRWGLSLSRIDIDSHEGTEETKDVWLFNDAPRSTRLRAIDKIPDLITSLARETERTAKEIIVGAEIASELLKSVNAAVTAKEKRR